MRVRDFEFISLEQFGKDLNKRLEKPYSAEEIEELYKVLNKPRRATRRSSGYDIYSPIEFTLEPGQSIVIPLGLKAYMLEDEEVLLFPRSSVGSKFKIRIDNTIGKIDSDYYNNPDNEGHIMLFMTNTGSKVWEVSVGQAIAQASFYKYLTTDTDNPVSEERTGGVGSTDKAK